MRRLGTLGFALSSALALGLAGCSDQAGVEEKTKITTPDGSTTITKKSTVETSGSHADGASGTVGIGTSTSTGPGVGGTTGPGPGSGSTSGATGSSSTGGPGASPPRPNNP